MRAIGYTQPGPPDVLQDITLPDPVAAARDLLVEVKAISVNPVDMKVRQSAGPVDGQPYRVLGYDAAGVVKAVGPEVKGFRAGDEVFYAGTLLRQGTNAQLHLVDERIVAHKPKSLDFDHAAALPLTAITAWELLFDRLGAVPGGKDDTRLLLIVGAAGGVGSILVQLARQLTGLHIIGTASRPETKAWVQELGAHQVIDHSQPLPPQLNGRQPDLIASLTNTQDHFPQLAEILAPQGHLGLIDDPASIDVKLLKRKAASLHWEYMFARSMFQTADIEQQGELLKQVATMVDSGAIRTTAGENLGIINAANLRSAHERIATGKVRGKLVLSGWE
ncbi:zinc-binding alcohol dehydrogenase family protein [Terriglobus albidus]|uniref:Zinc-type alcohol dehydrogenase-like protein n=1 Tax=Terriglobus albidus TaxID=1592106 RepID=A0A5B9E8Z8_9BACT|nr:zinc-binding alcohol dehydrogenase family protein [Terriglobus albidus]QEE26971.1 zinc-binding alcohol dehydrogenase family protein [Terriglobus albidus]